MSLRDQLQNMSPREQKLLSLLGVLFAVSVFIGLPVYIYSTLSSARERNDGIRALLRNIDKANELLAKRKRERLAAELKYAQPAPALASFIEGAARANGLDVPEASDRPDNALKGFTERVTIVKMRKVSLLPLVKMLEKIERSGHPVSISQLSVKTRASGPDLYDVTIAVSAFDKIQPPKTKTGDSDGKGKAGEAAPKVPTKPKASGKKGQKL